MIYVEYSAENENLVTFVHHMPFDEVHGLGKSKTELEKTGVFVDSVPELVNIEGKVARLYLNPATRTLEWKHFDSQRPEDRVAQLEQQLKITQDALDALLLG
ncbi:hypothetical protein [Brevibacillus centrosporus]|uniref:Uncharacterized protein n=1 Tax=Brevibacillus centrosporus TaxID=54910 RepID=A0A1I3LYB6_9BACL|nr:hypothetical protein [Brevibacillus centrosporus]SFI89550.1 hypothetical protein SAMN05518846_101459 [Brevibacillus centrosporus]